MKNLFRMLCIGIVFWLGGCMSTGPQPVAIREHVSGKSIAVASISGQKLAFIWLGTTSLTNESSSQPIPEWKLDEVMTNRAVLSMQQTNRYNEVLALDGTRGTAEDLRRLAHDKHADFLILIENGIYHDPTNYSSTMYLSGVGIFQHTVLNHSLTLGFAALKISIIDVQSGQTVATLDRGENWATNVKFHSGPSINEDEMQDFKHVALITVPNAIDGTLGKLGLL